MTNRQRARSTFLAATALLLSLPHAFAQVSRLESVSYRAAELSDFQGNGDSYVQGWRGAISSDGRIIAFSSMADSLVLGDTNGFSDVFVRDLSSGVTTRVSVGSTGMQGDGHSHSASISADGRFVAFTSQASNLVPGDSDGHYDIFVHDRHTGVTISVSKSTEGVGGNSWSESPMISGDGTRVAFSSYATNLVAGDTNGVWDIFLHVIPTGVTQRVSVSSEGTQATHESRSAALSYDGRYVAFDTDAPQLVAGDTGGFRDVFVRDTVMGTTSRVSLASSGQQASGHSQYASLSADGRYVTFSSSAWNLDPQDGNGRADVFLHDRTDGSTRRLTNGDGDSRFAAISADAGFVAFVSNASNLAVGQDTNGTLDVFVQDLSSGITMRASNRYATTTAADALSTMPSLSADGRFVAFYSQASTLVGDDDNGHTDVFRHDRISKSTQRASLADASGPFAQPANGSSSIGRGRRAISSDARYVAFLTEASNIVPNAPLFSARAVLFDRQTNVAELVSVAANGSAVVAIEDVSISPDARFAVFSTYLPGVVEGDHNNRTDVFLRDRLTGHTERISIGLGGLDPDDTSRGGSISADGRFVAFESHAKNLVSGDTNAAIDVFVADRQTGAIVRASVGPGGAQANFDSYAATISEDGRFVAFVSRANNLVTDDVNGYEDVYVRDLQRGRTLRVSFDPGNPYDGSFHSPSISRDGRFIAFTSSSSSGALAQGVYVRDMLAETTERIVGPVRVNMYGGTSISPDGRHVGFSSDSGTIVPGDINATYDVFVHDRATRTTRRASVDRTGTEGNRMSDAPSLSDDGTTLAFVSWADTWSLDEGTQGTYPDVFVSEWPADAPRPEVDLRIDKTDHRGYVGGTVLYEIVASSMSQHPVNGARVKDVVPPQLSHAVWSCTVLSLASCTHAVGTGDLDALVTLAPGGSVRFDLLADVDAPLGTLIRNTATISAPFDVSEAVVIDNVDSDDSIVAADGLMTDGFEE